MYYNMSGIYTGVLGSFRLVGDDGALSVSDGSEKNK